ncbi:MAG TPA: FMN-binding protein [Casimicrobiaceae bacterium]|nr:FMN-binding protein [Casimicrobiaceae bacterium]
MRHTWIVASALATAVAPTAQVAFAVEYMDVAGAQRSAYPEATAFEPYTVSAEARADIARDAGRFVGVPQVWRVRSGERLLGWFIVDEVIGKVERITYSVALDPSGAITRLDVLAYRESHGDAIKLPAWRMQFKGKRSSDPVRLDADIRNISGSTLSCRHVTEGVHRLLLLYDRVLAHA